MAKTTRLKDKCRPPVCRQSPKFERGLKEAGPQQALFASCQGLEGDVWQRPGWLLLAVSIRRLESTSEQTAQEVLHELGQVGMPTRSWRVSDRAINLRLISARSLATACSSASQCLPKHLKSLMRPHVPHGKGTSKSSHNAWVKPRRYRVFLSTPGCLASGAHACSHCS